jgi:hypothetical protein
LNNDAYSSPSGPSNTKSGTVPATETMMQK